MSKTYLKVIRVMGGGNLNNARAEIRFNIFVGNNRYLAVTPAFTTARALL